MLRNQDVKTGNPTDHCYKQTHHFAHPADTAMGEIVIPVVFTVASDRLRRTQRNQSGHESPQSKFAGVGQMANGLRGKG